MTETRRKAYGADFLAMGGLLLIAVSLAFWDWRIAGLFCGLACVAMAVAWAREVEGRDG